MVKYDPDDNDYVQIFVDDQFVIGLYYNDAMELAHQIQDLPKE